MMNCIRSNLSLIGKQCKQQSSLVCPRFLSVAAPKVVSEDAKKPKTGILMLNMGGPKTKEEVPNYLLRIMTDTDMIQLPVQSTLGPLIAKRRTAEVQKKYEEIGGGSPILKWTERQGELLCKKLDEVSPGTGPHKYYVAFRYANPLTEDTLEQIERDGLERVVIFSQYPQYSCATTGSSFNAIYKYYKTRCYGLVLFNRVCYGMNGEFFVGLYENLGSLVVKAPLPSGTKWSIIDRWSTHPLLAKTVAERIRNELKDFPNDVKKDVILLFSAHSLPLKAVNRGDSYPWEVGATVQAVMQELKYSNPYTLVWQSKVGPLPWLEPATDDALKGYVKQGKKNFILVPIAFVNEHIETLHEMDIEYCNDLASEIGVQMIRRAAAPNDHPIFIDALTDLVKNHLNSSQLINPKFLTRCPHCTNPRCQQSKSWYASLCNGEL